MGRTLAVVAISVLFVLAVARAAFGRGDVPSRDPGVLHFSYVTYSDNGTPPDVIAFISAVHAEISRRNPKFVQMYPSF